MNNRWLDWLTAVVVVVGLAFLFAIVDPLYRMTLLAAVGCALYGWRTGDKELVQFSCLAPPLCVLNFAAVNYLSALSHHGLLDATFARADHGAAVAVWRWCSLHSWTMTALAPAYNSLWWVLVIAIAVSDRRVQFVRALFLAAALGMTSYWMFPAVGPAHVGQSGALINCMPSLHVAFSALCWLYASRRWRTPMFIFALLTAAATMATGEHYLVDVIAAIPFTAAMVWISSTFNWPQPAARKRSYSQSVAVRPLDLIYDSEASL